LATPQFFSNFLFLRLALLIQSFVRGSEKQAYSKLR